MTIASAYLFVRILSSENLGALSFPFSLFLFPDNETSEGRSVMVDSSLAFSVIA